MARREGGPAEERPLLGGGERLRQTVDRTGAGGPKFHPQSFEEAQRVLAPQLEQLRSAVAETPARLRGARVVFEATVLPNTWRTAISQGSCSTRLTSCQWGRESARLRTSLLFEEPEQRPTKTYLLSGDERSLQKVADLLSAGPSHRGRLGAASDRLRQFTELRLPTVDEVVRPHAELPEAELITWEAVIHPAVSAVGELTAEEQTQVFEKWGAFVRDLGEEAAEDFRRVVRGMTFVPVRLPSDAAEASARSIRCVLSAQCPVSDLYLRARFV